MSPSSDSVCIWSRFSANNLLITSSVDEGVGVNVGVCVGVAVRVVVGVVVGLAVIDGVIDIVGVLLAVGVGVGFGKQSDHKFVSFSQLIDAPLQLQSTGKLVGLGVCVGV